MASADVRKPETGRGDGTFGAHESHFAWGGSELQPVIRDLDRDGRPEVMIGRGSLPGATGDQNVLSILSR